MVYIFENVDRNGSRRRVIYERLGPVIKHVARYGGSPKIRRSGNAIF